MDVKSFIERWGASGGAERTNYAQFLSELCRVLGVPEPEPTRPDDADNAYVFERSVSDPHDKGRATVRRIDLYFKLSADEVRDRFPGVYQHVLLSVKPERD